MKMTAEERKIKRKRQQDAWRAAHPEIGKLWWANKKKEDPDYNKKRYKRQMETNAEYHKDKFRKNYLKNTYDITPDDYNAMFKKQDGLCAICNLPSHKTRLDIDHNHTTGAIRGLLCRTCNVGIGSLKEDENLFQKAAQYLHVYATENLTTSRSLQQ